MRYSVYPETAPGAIPGDAEALHLVRPVKGELLLRLVGRCKSLKEISMPKSCSRRLSGKVRKILGERNIRLNAKKYRGRAISLDLERMLSGGAP